METNKCCFIKYDEMMLKSDHCGMETNIEHVQLPYEDDLLKSDHSGMETLLLPSSFSIPNHS